jgi:hypothetical protein
MPDDPPDDGIGDRILAMNDQVPKIGDTTGIVMARDEMAQFKESGGRL